MSTVYSLVTHQPVVTCSGVKIWTLLKQIGAVELRDRPRVRLDDIPLTPFLFR